MAVSRQRETDRLESFSDGIFAFGITLLVLNLYDPMTRGSTDLLRGLADEWPAFFAFATSFMTILVMWINHHNMFNYIHRVSREFMLLNGLLLFFVVLTPFTTLLVSEHLVLKDSHTAAGIYAGSFVALAIVWNILWQNATHHHNLIGAEIPQVQIDRITREYIFGPAFYGAAFVIAFFSAVVAVVAVIMIAVFYAVTVSGGEQA